jgi:hypothetical protein
VLEPQPEERQQAQRALAVAARQAAEPAVLGLVAPAKMAHPAALASMPSAELAQARRWGLEAPMLLATRASAELRALPGVGQLPWSERDCLPVVPAASLSADED